MSGFNKEQLVYICGDKKNMAQDVHNALLEIIEKEGGMSREKAEEYLADMKQQQTLST